MTNGHPRRIRVLHVIGTMDRGGIETWLMNVLRTIDRTRFEFQFLVHSDTPGAYDDEAIQLGAAIVRGPVPRRPWQYASTLQKILREQGPFDVVHSHVHHFSGVVAALAYRAGVPTRIVHCHSDTSALQATASARRKVYLRFTEHLVRKYATVRLAASTKAASALFGDDALQAGRCRLLYYGIDLSQFSPPAGREAVRDELGLPRGALVIGHVGNLLPVKNHPLLLKIVAEIRKTAPSVRLVLVGGGPLKAELESLSAELGCSDAVVFSGVRKDVHRVLRAFDVFVFPSWWEGLPMAVLEAQAAGLPVVLSSNVSSEADVVPGLVRWQSPDASVDSWIDSISSAAACPAVGQSIAVAHMANGPFDITTSIRALGDIYAGVPESHGCALSAV